MRNLIPGRIDTKGYSQVTLQSDYDRNGSLTIGFDDQGDVYVETVGNVRFAATSSSFVGAKLKEHLIDLVRDALSDVKIGTEVECQGKTYVCKPALPDSEKGNLFDDCEGCAFCNGTWRSRTCGNFFCAADERSDNTNVRFVEKGGDR